MFVAERRTRHDVLVNADRALHFAAPPVDAAEREVGLDRLVVDVDHPQEDFERLVGLFVEQKAQALEIVLVQPARRLLAAQHVRPLGSLRRRRCLRCAVAQTELRHEPAGGRGDEQRHDQVERQIKRHFRRRLPAPARAFRPHAARDAAGRAHRAARRPSRRARTVPPADRRRSDDERETERRGDAQERELDLDPLGVHRADEQGDQRGEGDGEVEEDSSHKEERL